MALGYVKSDTLAIPTTFLLNFLRASLSALDLAFPKGNDMALGYAAHGLILGSWVFTNIASTCVESDKVTPFHGSRVRLSRLHPWLSGTICSFGHASRVRVTWGRHSSRI